MTDIFARLVAQVVILSILFSILCPSQSASAAAKARVVVDPELLCEQISAGAPIEGQVSFDRENLKLSNSRKWPSSFQSDEADVMRSLARLKLESEKVIASGSNSILRPALTHAYQTKYSEVLNSISKNHSNLSNQDFDAVLRFEITRAQASADLKREQQLREQSEARQQEEVNLPRDFSRIELVDTRTGFPITSSIEYFEDASTQVLPDGRLLFRASLKYAKNVILNPITNVADILPDGQLVRVTPDGKLMVVLRKERKSPFHWRLVIYDVIKEKPIKSIRIHLDKGSEPLALSDFNEMDISPSGEKLAVSMKGNRVVVIEIKSGKVLDVVDNGSQANHSFYDRVFFTDEESIVFLNTARIIKHDLKDGTQISTNFASPGAPIARSILTPDRRTLVIAKFDAFYAVSTVDLLPVTESKIPYIQNEWTEILKPIRGDSRYYIAATRGDWRKSEDIGIYGLNHEQVFDFNGRYVSGRKVYDFVVSFTDNVIYVFYTNVHRSGSESEIHMDVWRIPQK